MAVFKCKMCGGSLDISKETVVTCEFCGTQQTLPRLDDDHRANLYDRANHFRRNNEFDKATGIYELILNEDKTDSEAYWSLVLCRYGIEYVEDPRTHKRIPTINRAQYTSIYDDENYKSALEYADTLQKGLYQSEASAINEIQKEIIAVSQTEAPFDIFICYKETDNFGRRTMDSVIATDLYNQLNREGFRVFFSRITLEDKLGSAYEPYIFAALNSAKIMIVLGTNKEHFQAVWVQNEWRRYLSLIKQGEEKVLIPAYKDMDPYDLPEEFAHLQAQDMSKLGFMQDLIRGIQKILQADAPKTNSLTASTTPLLKRAFMALEDGEWDKADGFCEQALNIDAECADAYLGKLLAELKVKSKDQLLGQSEPFAANGNFQKYIRFCTIRQKEELTNINKAITEHNEANQSERLYQDACNLMAKHQHETYMQAIKLFESIVSYKDSAQKIGECETKAETVLMDIPYNAAKTLLQNGNYAAALQKFETIPDWRDTQIQIAFCKQQIQALQQRNAQIKRQEEAHQIKLQFENQQKFDVLSQEREKMRREKLRKLFLTLGYLGVFLLLMFIWIAIRSPG